MAYCIKQKSALQCENVSYFISVLLHTIKQQLSLLVAKTRVVEKPVGVVTVAVAIFYILLYTIILTRHRFEG